MSGLPTRMLVVWCPDWPVASAGLSADAAAAVFKANRVVACSARARAEGIRRGLRRREAQARYPDLVVLEHDPAREARVFEPIVATVESFAPRVEVVRPGVCAVPTRGPSRYFGGDEALVAKVREAVLARSGHRCLVGVADGAFAATLAARRGQLVARGEAAAFLAPFPVRALERPELVDLLIRLGIRTLGQFAALPPDDVLARFGNDGALAHRLARGLDERPPATRTPPPDLVVERELDPPAQRVDMAAFVGKALADELHERLARQGLACTRVAVEAETAHGESLRRLWRHEGALTPAAMAERVRWQLDGWLSGSARQEGDPRVQVDPDVDVPDATAGLTLLRLVPDEVVPDDGRQLGFWGGATEADERAARAMARVQGMLGPGAVVTPVLAGGRLPLDEVELVPWGDPREPDRRPRPRRLPAAEAPPSEAAVPPAPAPGGPATGGPATGGPATGDPADGASGSGAPGSGAPGSGAPATGGPATGDPADGAPGSGGPATGGPATGDPADGAPGSGGSADSGPADGGTAGRRRRSGHGKRRTAASEALTPPWPGHLPAPSPTKVYDDALPAVVLDEDGRPVRVTGRHQLSGAPARLAVDGGPPADIAGWAGPWPVDERWWDPPAHRRQARFQVVAASGAAYLLSVANGAWQVEAAYD